jgi:hypothetical protein
MPTIWLWLTIPVSILLTIATGSELLLGSGAFCAASPTSCPKP